MIYKGYYYYYYSM